MDGMSGQKPFVVWALNISVVLLTLLWLFPTLGLFVSSFRTSEQITASGWWSAMFASEQTLQLRVGDPDDTRVETAAGVFVVQGTIFTDGVGVVNIDSWGTSSRATDAFAGGDTSDLGDGETLILNGDGTYIWQGDGDQISGRAQRLFINATVPPEFSSANYDAVLGQGVVSDLFLTAVVSAIVGVAAFFAMGYLLPGLSVVVAGTSSIAVVGVGFFALLRNLPINDIKLWSVFGIIIAGGALFGVLRKAEPDAAKVIAWAVALFVFVLIIVDYGLGTGVGATSASEDMGKAFLNTLTVVIPATIIPILIASFAAYALAWMDFPGRALLIAAVVALLVVPLQLALIPLLTFHNAIGIGKGYLGTWMAHTGFGLPLAIYLLRNYMVGLPRDIIENARVDGATEFQIFTKIILPLSFPALASFAIFQFLWTWNDLLVALVFLIDSSGNTTVMTKQIVELLGTRGGDWEILATSAFVSIAVPLLVFFMMQKYLVRGLLAGSVK